LDEEEKGLSSHSLKNSDVTVFLSNLRGSLNTLPSAVLSNVSSGMKSSMKADVWPTASLTAND
jgi:hypothetical protein